MRGKIVHVIPVVVLWVWLCVFTFLSPQSIFIRVINVMILVGTLLGEIFWFFRNYSLQMIGGRLTLRRRNADELSVLNRILTLINEERSLEEILRHIVAEAMNLIPAAETSSFVIYNPLTGFFEFKEAGVEYAEIALTPEEVESKFEGKKGPFLDTEVAQSNNRFRDEVKVELEKSGVPQAIIFIPIWVDGQLQGYITLDNWTSKDAFKEGDLRHIEQILPQLVLAFSKTFHRFELTEYKNKFEQLYKLGQRLVKLSEPDELIERVVQFIGRTLKYSDSSILFVEGERLVFQGGYKHKSTYVPTAPYMNIRDGICGWVARYGQAQIISDVSKDPRYLQRSSDIRSELVVPIMADQEILGVINLESKRLKAFKVEDQELMMTVASQLGIALSNLRHQNELKTALLQIITALAKSIETKDHITGGHCERMETFALEVGKGFGLNPERSENLRRAAILHDIGKIGIPSVILDKPGRLSEEEFKIMQEHPTFGAKILREVDFLQQVATIVEQHHERMDGKGYPNGLKGKEILLEAKIIAVVDAYDAMTSDRPYRGALKQEIAIAELRKHRGTQFDPQIVDYFVKLLQSNKLGGTDHETKDFFSGIDAANL